jgi:hypothetical protein
VLARLRDLRGGDLNDTRFGTRMRGEGAAAVFLADLFRKARGRAGIPAKGPVLDGSAFRPPAAEPSLFDE